MEPNIKTVYLSTIFDPDLFQRTVPKTIEAARRLKEEHNYDTIVFSGTSGDAMGFILGYSLHMPILCVRRGELSHYWGYRHTLLEGNFGVGRYLIVDDFISGGDTVNRIIDTVSKENPNAECVAMLMYAENGDKTHQHPKWNKPVNVISSKPLV